jgi:hypothetical protein
LNDRYSHGLCIPQYAMIDRANRSATSRLPVSLR